MVESIPVELHRKTRTESHHVETLKRENTKYLWRSMQSKESAAHPLLLESAKGSSYRDMEGKEYLDGCAGVYVVNVGYGRREVLDAMKAQMDKLSYNCSIYSTTESTITAAKKLAEVAPSGLEKVFFVSGGSEGTETAIKMARQYHALKGHATKYRLIGRWMSYHGCTLGALSASGHMVRRKLFEPLLLNFPHISAPYCYRCPYDKSPDKCELECARELERVIKSEGAESISAFIAEPIGGFTAGALVPPREYLRIIREICDKYDILLIADEIITGFGRTGEWFAVEHSGVTPDLMILGKGMTSGYAPGGAVISTEVFARLFDEKDSIFQHGYTYAAHPATTAATAACIDIMKREKLIERAARMGMYLMKRLKELEAHRIVGDVRGIGLMGAVELVKDKKTREMFGPNEDIGHQIAERMSEKGVKIFGTKGCDTGMISDMLALGPPLIITREEIDRIVDCMDETIGETERRL